MRSLLQPDKQSPSLILTTLPVPIPKPNEHLIRVHATAITNNELNWAKNFPSLPVAPDKLAIPCYDLAGTIVSSVPDSKFKPGDEVWARTDYFRSGTASEYTTAPVKELALRSKKLGWAESATVPMSALTAWQALFTQAGLTPAAGSAKGKRIFVTAASGGVGTWVVQFAKWTGATVIGTCGSDNVESVKALGTDEVLDYRKVDIKNWASSGNGEKKADLVIDCIGGKSLQDAWWTVKNGGTLLSINQYPESAKPEEIDDKERQIKNFFFIMDADGEQLGEITKLIDERDFVTALDSVFPLEGFEEATKKLASGRTKGKIVFDLGVGN